MSKSVFSIKNIFNYNTFLYFFISILLLWVFNCLWAAAITSDPYTQGDWLINYQDGGFKRRGLSGSIFFLLQDITGLRLQWLVFIFQSVLYSAFFLLFCIVFYRKKITLEYFLYFVSPVTFYFFINNPEVVGRKEILLFLLFLVYYLILEYDLLRKRNERVLFIFLVVAVLFHELTLFYLPYFLLLKYVYTKKFDLKLMAALSIMSFVSILVIFLFGAEINNGSSVKILQERGFTMENGLGIFGWNTNTIDFIKHNITHYLRYLISFVYGVLLLYLLIKNNVFGKRHMILILICFIYTIPLFYLAVDWGRWINIHFVMLSVLLLKSLPKSQSFSESRIVLKLKYFGLYILIISNFMFGMGYWNNGFSSAVYRKIKSHILNHNSLNK
jgi:hypothetical protein